MNANEKRGVGCIKSFILVTRTFLTKYQEKPIKIVFRNLGKCEEMP